MVADVATDGDRKSDHVGRHVADEKYGALPPSYG
jgi:hypothetical protein